MAKETGSCVYMRILFPRHFLKTVEQRVHHDDIRLETVNARGDDQIEGRGAPEAVPQTQKAVCREPAYKFKKVRPRQAGNPVPINFPRLFGAPGGGSTDSDILDALRIEMNLAIMTPRQSLEQFGQGAFRAVAAIHERRNYGQAQISESNEGQAAREQRRQIERQAQARATGIAPPGEATNRR